MSDRARYCAFAALMLVGIVAFTAALTVLARGRQ